MTTLELLADLRALDVALSTNGDRLHVTSPKGALTPELKAELAEQKGELLVLLSAAPRPCPSCGGEARRLGNYVSKDGYGRYHCGLDDCLVIWRRPTE